MVIPKTKKVQMTKNGVDYSHLGKHNNWWFDLAFSHSFTLFDLDTLYEKHFETDHVGKEQCQNYVNYILTYCYLFLNKPITSVLELGAGGGWFTEAFLERGIDVIAVEGTREGIQKAIERGIPETRLIRHDLRLPLSLNRQFDICICTEVAEHVEPPFSSQLVYTIISHSKLVWFSFAEDFNKTAHGDIYHHPNIMPLKFWKNLFRFHGYKMIPLPRRVKTFMQYRGGYICYSKELEGNPPNSDKIDSIAFGLGFAPHKASSFKTFLKSMIPPLIYSYYVFLKRRRFIH